MTSENAVEEAGQSETNAVLPLLFQQSIPVPTLLAQGAEAHVYRTTYLTPSLPCVLKYRPPKPYRHPTLDLRLTRHRLLTEARALHKCRRAGVLVPAVYALDAEAGWLLMEWIEGRSLRKGLEDWIAANANRSQVHTVQDLMGRVGRAVGKLHAAGVVHGDLTTSNLMLRPPPRSMSMGEGEIEEDADAGVRPTSLLASTSETGSGSEMAGDVIVIDFGLAAQSVQDEDRAVDLYVLERAFGSTHPRAETLFQEVLRSYGTSFKGAAVVLRRLEDVRLRGRKRSMLG